MEELKIIMEALAKMGEGAQTAFIAWCIKEVVVYALAPITFVVLGCLSAWLVPKFVRLAREGGK